MSMAQTYSAGSNYVYDIWRDATDIRAAQKTPLKKRGNMNTQFEIDLTNHQLKFGNIANGEIQSIDCELKITSERGSIPYSGMIKGEYLGEIKSAMTIPVTIAHTPVDRVSVQIVIVGAGGTGGYVIRDFIRYIFALKEKGDTREFKIKIVDADVVEEKNILRQNFLPRDLGLNKAEISAKRYSGAFGIEIESIQEMITKENIADIIGNPNGQSTDIIVGCVDNHEARRAIDYYCTNHAYNGTYWIDSGNERKSGQVVCGYGIFQSDSRYTYYSPKPNSTYPMPHITNLYPEILDPANDPIEDETSCADRAVQDTQNIFVNMMAANYVLSFLRQIISKEKITINSIHFNIKGVTTVSHLTEQYLKEIAQQKNS